jgi:hypothetical protein
MQKHTSSWIKELSLIRETGTGCDKGKLNWKKEKDLKIYIG